MRTAKELTTTSVPKARADETAGFALERLREQKLEEASHLYLVDEVSVLTGQVPIERLIAAAPETPLLVKVKSVASTPLTFLANVTVKRTLAALVGLSDRL